MLYFDHNATHPLDPRAAEVWLEASRTLAANPSSLHRPGARATAALDEARATLAGWLQCRPEQLVWTSGATEANNALLHHLAQSQPGEVWISAVEHASTRAAAQRWLPGRHQFLPVVPQGTLDLDWLQAQRPSPPPAAIMLLAAHNETGVLQPWIQTRDWCRQHGVAFACDAAQWIGKLPAAGLGSCDYVSGCAHKFGGPPGIGFLQCSNRFQPLLVGGPQEDGRRAGTENLPAILAMVATLAAREAALADPSFSHRFAWRDQFIEQLKQAIPEVQVVGEPVPRLWNTVAALLPPPTDCRRRWAAKLDRLGFAVSTGSACANGKEQVSPTLAAMGYAPRDSDRMVRFSAGWDTTEEDWTHLLIGLRTAHQLLRG